MGIRDDDDDGEGSAVASTRHRQREAIAQVQKREGNRLQYAATRCDATDDTCPPSSKASGIDHEIIAMGCCDY